MGLDPSNRLEGSVLKGHEICSPLESKYQASLLGFVIGDALGAATETLPRDEIRERFGKVEQILGLERKGIERGDGTDDTQMLLCVARSLAETGQLCLTDIADRFVEWYLKKPIGLGDICRKGISRYYNQGSIEAPYDVLDAGNGGVMRSLPTILRYRKDRRTAKFAAVTQSRITHNCMLSDHACEQYAELVLMALNGLSKEEIKIYLKSDPVFYQEEYDGRSGGYVVETMRSVLYCFLNTSNLRDSLITATNLGYDTDTIAALTGGVAGAFYGLQSIPNEWTETLNSSIWEECRLLSKRLVVLSENQYESSFSDFLKHRGIRYSGKLPFDILDMGMDIFSRYKASLLGVAIGEMIANKTKSFDSGRICGFPAASSDIIWEASIKDEITEDLPATAAMISLAVAESLCRRKGHVPRDVAWRMFDGLKGKHSPTDNTYFDAYAHYKDTGGGEAPYDSKAIGVYGLFGVLPVVLFFHCRAEEIRDAAVAQSRITNNNEVSDISAMCFAEVLLAVLRGKNKEELMNIEGTMGYESYTSKKDPLSGFKLALDAVLETSSFVSAIETVVAASNGDSSVSALCGGLAGAYYGLSSIPKSWIARMNRELNSQISNIAEKLYSAAMAQ